MMAISTSFLPSSVGAFISMSGVWITSSVSFRSRMAS